MTKGSMAIELMLWLVFLLPGIIYTVWRLTTRHQACRTCGASELVPTDSPRAQMALGAGVAR